MRFGAAFACFGVLFGVAYAFFLPPLQAPDEFAHFYRDYSVATGDCVAPHITDIPQSVADLKRAFPANLEIQRRIDSSYITRFTQAPLEDAKREPTTNEAANLYNCAPYVPGALGMEIGRVASMPAVNILYLIRLLNLAVFLALTWLAFRWMPGFRVALFAVALMPMTLSQAASASWDGLVFCMAFLLCAYLLKLAWDPAIAILSARHYWILAGAVALAAVCKADAWLVVLLMLVPASRFGGSSRKWSAVAGAALLVVMVVSGWNFVNRADTAAYVEHLKDRGVHMSDNLALVTQNPVAFVEELGRTITTNGASYAAEFVGKLGWLAVSLPAWIVGFYLAGLVAIAVLDDPAGGLTPVQRVVCLAVAAAAAGSVFVGMWSAETTQEVNRLALQGKGTIGGVQGRYFIPFAIPLLLVLTNRRWLVRGPWLGAAAALLVVTANAAALYEIRGTYYLTGDVVKDFDKKLVTRGASADGKDYFLVESGQRHWIMHQAWIARHGYRWPEDVLEISQAQFQAIPEGAPINELSGDPATDYEGKLVRRPGSSLEDGKVFLIEAGKKRWVKSSAWIVKHGFHWPGDVLTISPSELAAVPEGAEIVQ